MSRSIVVLIKLCFTINKIKTILFQRFHTESVYVSDMLSIDLDPGCTQTDT